MKVIKVNSYNANWPRMYEAEAAFIKDALGEHCLELHHIGSTSVPGLNAKEDLDILCVVDTLKSSLVLESKGFVFKGEINIPLRYFFSKNTEVSKVNLHFVELGHGFIKLNLAFRDHLRADAEIRMAYGKLKEELVSDPKNFQRMSGRFRGYSLGKDIFIKDALRKIGFDNYLLNFCVHYQEWETYHRLHEASQASYDRNKQVFTAENHYHLVLYKGVDIVSAAHVEFDEGDRAFLITLVTNTEFDEAISRTEMTRQIEKWAKVHGKSQIWI